MKRRPKYVSFRQTARKSHKFICSFDVSKRTTTLQAKIQLTITRKLSFYLRGEIFYKLGTQERIVTNCSLLDSTEPPPNHERLCRQPKATKLKPHYQNEAGGSGNRNALRCSWKSQGRGPFVGFCGWLCTLNQASRVGFQDGL